LVVQHPSLSRHHCVIQFGDGEDKTFLCDLGSTHGTFLNKSQLKPLEYSPIKLTPTRPTEVRSLMCRDGDMFKLGYSTRIYIFVESQLEDEKEVSFRSDIQSKYRTLRLKRGEELRDQTKRLRGEYQKELFPPSIPARSEGICRNKHFDVETTKTRRKNNVVCYRENSLYAPFCSKLERHKEKIQSENKKIHEKESKFEELTPEQIATLLDNERRMEQLNAEIDELEESIQTSILEKINPSRAKVLPVLNKLRELTNQARIERKEEENSGSDDEFYDRTKKSRSVKTKPTTTEDLISEKYFGSIEILFIDVD